MIEPRYSHASKFWVFFFHRRQRISGKRNIFWNFSKLPPRVQILLRSLHDFEFHWLQYIFRCACAPFLFIAVRLARHALGSFQRPTSWITALPSLDMARLASVAGLKWPLLKRFALNILNYCDQWRARRTAIWEDGARHASHHATPFFHCKHNSVYESIRLKRTRPTMRQKTSS